MIGMWRPETSSCLPDCLGGLEAVHLRHLHIHQHNVEVFFLHAAHGKFAVCRYLDFMSLLLKQARAKR